MADRGLLSTGAVAIDQTNEIVAPSRIRAIAHHPREQVPHEGPDPQEIGWWVLLGAVFFPEKRTNLEEAAWPEWRARNGVPRVVTGTDASSVLVARIPSEAQKSGLGRGARVVLNE